MRARVYLSVSARVRVCERVRARVIMCVRVRVCACACLCVLRGGGGGDGFLHKFAPKIIFWQFNNFNSVLHTCTAQHANPRASHAARSSTPARAFFCNSTGHRSTPASASRA